MVSDAGAGAGANPEERNTQNANFVDGRGED